MSEVDEKESGSPKIIVIAVVVIAVAIVVFMVTMKKGNYVPTAPGEPAIDFTLPDLEGKQYSLKDYRGKVVFLNFWATWCEPCKEEMPSMEIMYQAFQRRGFEIIAVSVDSGDTSVVKEFQKEYGLSFPILHDKRGKIKERYKTTGVPETFIIDQNGIIAEKIMGTRDWNNAYNIKTILDLLDNGPRTPEAYRNARGRK